MIPGEGRGPGRGDEAGRLLAEAAGWRLLSLLFERPRSGWGEEIEALAREAGDPLLGAAAAAARGADEGRYLALLGPGGRVSPREVAYRPLEDPGRILADLSAFYGAFAFRPRAEDPVDHVAVLAGFAGYLSLKEAYALDRGDADGAAVAVEARARFVGTHLRPLAGPLHRRLAGAGGAWLAGAARALEARAGDAPDPDRAPQGGTEGQEEGCAFSCGGGPGRG